MKATIHPYWLWEEHPNICLVCGRRKRAIRHLLFKTDPDSWLGWTTDPAETTTFCAWLRLGHHWWIYYVWPFRLTTKRF